MSLLFVSHAIPSAFVHFTLMECRQLLTQCECMYNLSLQEASGSKSRVHVLRLRCALLFRVPGKGAGDRLDQLLDLLLWQALFTLLHHLRSPQRKWAGGYRRSPRSGGRGHPAGLPRDIFLILFIWRSYEILLHSFFFVFVCYLCDRLWTTLTVFRCILLFFSSTVQLPLHNIILQHLLIGSYAPVGSPLLSEVCGSTAAVSPLWEHNHETLQICPNAECSCHISSLHSTFPRAISEFHKHNFWWL